MLSSLPKLADRNFIIGFFLPALFGMALASWSFPDIKFLTPLRNLTASSRDINDAVYAVAITWLLAVVLMTSNYGIYRFYEGYTFPSTWLPWIKRCKVIHWNKLKLEYDNIHKDYSKAVAEGVSFPADRTWKLSRLGILLHTDFPSEESEILPTRFGNRIRAFEVYSRNAYGADSVPVWDRLLSVIPKPFLESINESRAQVDLYLNISLIALIFFLSQVVINVRRIFWKLDPAALSGLSEMLKTHPLLALVTSAIVFLTGYNLATHAVVNWGKSVKSAFDCFLPSLLAQLGYDIPHRDDRKSFWTEFSQLAIYGETLLTDWPLSVLDTTTREARTGGEQTEQAGGGEEADKADEPSSE